MCQSKAQGGKRCFAHSSFSKFVTRFVQLKTGADDTMINETMRELNKEGKNLPDVSAAEANAWIDKKRFATELDPELSDHDRKIQLNQLDKAKDEAKDGVKGSHFHAWKNLMKRVVSKMKKPFIAVGLAGVLTFGMAGCGQATNNNTPETTKSPTTTSQPTTSAAPTKPATDNAHYGDVIALKKVTDSKGSYEQTTIDPKDDSMIFNKSIVDPTATSAGFSDADLASAQKYAVTFVSQEGSDSVAVDSDAGWAAWQKDQADKYIASGYKDTLLKPIGTFDRSAIILNDPNGSMPTVIRDGKPRLTTDVVSVSKISGGSDPSAGKYVTVTGTSTVKYRVTDEVAQAWVKKNNPNISEADIKRLTPGLFDGKENSFNVSMDWNYTLVKDGSSWKIGGYNNQIKLPGFVEAQAK